MHQVSCHTTQYENHDTNTAVESYSWSNRQLEQPPVRDSNAPLEIESFSPALSAGTFRSLEVEKQRTEYGHAAPGRYNTRSTGNHRVVSLVTIEDTCSRRTTQLEKADRDLKKILTLWISKGHTFARLVCFLLRIIRVKDGSAALQQQSVR